MRDRQGAAAVPFNKFLGCTLDIVNCGYQSQVPICPSGGPLAGHKVLETEHLGGYLADVFITMLPEKSALALVKRGQGQAWGACRPTRESHEFAILGLLSYFACQAIIDVQKKAPPCWGGKGRNQGGLYGRGGIFILVRLLWTCNEGL